MAKALERAAERFEERAKAMDERVASWRKNRHGDDTPVVAMTLHRVARELRKWAGAYWKRRGELHKFVAPIWGQHTSSYATA